MNATKTPPSPHVPTLTYAKQWVKKHHRDVSEKESMYLASTIYNFLATLPDFRSILEQCVMGDVRQTIELPAHASNDNMTATLPAPIADPPVPTTVEVTLSAYEKGDSFFEEAMIWNNANTTVHGEHFDDYFVPASYKSYVVKKPPGSKSFKKVRKSKLKAAISKSFSRNATKPSVKYGTCAPFRTVGVLTSTLTNALST